MKTLFKITFCLALLMTLGGCVSAWMATSTGTTLNFPPGMPRAQVVSKLGEPSSRMNDISPAARWNFAYVGREIRFVELFEYRGKINAPDEGGGQATVNALTLGLGEVVMIPMTAAEIAKRSTETNHIYVFYDSEEKVVGFIVNPAERYRPNKALEPTPTSVTPRAGARAAPAVGVARL